MTFLILMAGNKRDQATYDKYIDTKSKFELNLPGELRKNIIPNDMSSVPWDKITTTVRGGFVDNIVRRTGLFS